MIDPFGGMSARPIGNVLFYIRVPALLFGREIAVRLSFFDQLSRGRAMLFRIVGLKNFLFVVIETEPLEPFDDRTRRFIGRALQVGVFDAQQKLAADFAREQPIEERRACRADVQITSR